MFSASALLSLKYAVYNGTSGFAIRGSDARARFELPLLKTKELQALRDERASMDASLRSAALGETCVDLKRLIERRQEVEDILRGAEADLRELAALRTMLGEVVLPPQSVGTSGSKSIWATLTGDDRKRRCGECSGSVYDLAGMTHEEAVAFVVANEPIVGAVALHSRRDGRFHSGECAGAVAKIGRASCRERV